MRSLTRSSRTKWCPHVPSTYADRRTRSGAAAVFRVACSIRRSTPSGAAWRVRFRRTTFSTSFYVFYVRSLTFRVSTGYAGAADHRSLFQRESLKTHAKVTIYVDLLGKGTSQTPAIGAQILFWFFDL